MTGMLVLAFDSQDSAAKAKQKLIELDTQYLLKLDQVVEVLRKTDGQVKVKEEPKLTGIGAVGGAFWGLLIGIVFLIPVVGVAVGAATGAIAGHFANYGISKDFIRQTESAIQLGNAALFILADDVKIDRVIPMLAAFHPKVLRTSLSMDQEQQLREDFGNGESAPVAATTIS